MDIKCKKCVKCVVEFVRNDKGHDAVLPRKAYAGDAGYDLFSADDVVVQPGHRVLISTGWNIALPEGYEGQVRSRSGNALKKGAFVLNSPGTIDANYRGPVGVILFNASNMPIHVQRGDAVAQLVLAEVVTSEVKEVSSFSNSATERGASGFGSTGVV